ncbi:hypothetical protein Vadar_010827 [Vaccinium darrowii]|uniref:Uncharacterized protein n=1 Tax=Vaccinium darrowii TaxID=229202 RepID=A0ACB7ZKW5_9ERIC|nr:hypothetical protein Vadar_010827 [Vaccinium darrowii]
MKGQWNELPEELWESILDRLVLDEDDDYELHVLNHNYDDLESPSLVCKQFLSITNRLRHKFVYKESVSGTNWCVALSRAFERFRNFKEIGLSPLSNLSDVNSPILKIAHSGLDLQSIGLHGFPISPSAASFRRLGCTMTNLKVLRCSQFVLLRDPDLVHIADALPQLEELDIKHPRNGLEPWEDRYPELSNSEDRYPELSNSEDWYPKLSNHVVTDAGIMAISLKLKGLQRINISGNTDICNRFKGTYNTRFYGSSTTACLFHCKSGIRLETLELDGSHDFNINGFTTLLRACPTLKHFALYGGYLINHNEMSEMCRCLPNIISIDLGCSSTLTAIFSVFAKECPALSKITLRHAGSSIGSLEHIQDDFVMSQVRYLDLSYTRGLNDKLLKDIAVTCPNLHILEVEGCAQLTKEGLEEILKCCPQIKRLRPSFKLKI